MKTIKVRPTLIESKEKIHLNSIVLHAGFGLGQIIMDSEVECFYNRHKSGGSITTPWERNLKGRLLHYDLVLISLDSDEKIEKGTKYLDDCGLLRKAVTDDVVYWERRTDYKKVIATQSQLSPGLIQYIINQYNNGGMEDFEIEAIDKYIAPIGNKSDVPLDDSRLVCEPKLINGFVTCIAKQYPIGGFAPGNYENNSFTKNDLFEAFSRYAFTSINNQPYNEEELLQEFEKWFKRKYSK